MMTRMKFPTLLTALLLALGTGCQSVTPSQSLYDELGGMPVIERITDNFIEEIGFDPQILKHFQDTKIERFREKFIEQICFESGGPCDYSGDSMVDVHTKMQITEGEFNRTVDLLINAMNKAGVAHRTQNRLLAKLAPMRGDIIYR